MYFLNGIFNYFCNGIYIKIKKEQIYAIENCLMFHIY